VANASRQGERWITGMRAIAADFATVTNVRGLGLIMAFDMPDGDSRNALLGAMMEAGMIGLSSGERTVRFRPHLAITDADTDLCLELTRKALQAL
jgi:L-lysine 6-transaminase